MPRASRVSAAWRMVSQSDVLPMISATIGLRPGRGLLAGFRLEAMGGAAYLAPPRRETSTAFSQTREMAFCRRTTTVPAILSCQPCFSGSNAIQRKQRPMTMSDRNDDSARTGEVTQSIGLPSARTTFSPKMMPPMVAPLSFQRMAPYAAMAGMNKMVMWNMIPTRIASIRSAAIRIQNPALGSPASGAGESGGGARGAAAETTGGTDAERGA